ncbi:hypothetical protein QFC19_004626 [Naganishia cerealis]|uniref:Uncharacterized protein n=1 Tax=Naganishia cerealis TaxID=610337 RepID=A0ACC2VUF5_9TREE|nr:hypothetical protein QFC19_004626 [Naganishia cerealis]
MKSQVNHHRSKSRRTSTRSSVSTAAGSRVSIDSGNSGTTACTTAASITGESTRDKSISNASLIDYYGRSLVALEAPKQAPSMNYDSVADINEFLEVKKEQTRRSSNRKSRSSGSGSNSIASSRDPIQYQLVLEEPETPTQPSAKTIDEIPAPVLMTFKNIDFDGRNSPSQNTSQSPPEEDCTARNSASEPELTRCYSDESSIFSIRESDKERRRLDKVKNPTSDKKPKSKPKKTPVEIISNVAEPQPKGFSRFIKKLT